MTQSLITGASGLKAHQQKLDVVANNIANLNTTGYKSQNVLFSDLLYTELAPGIGPSGNLNGGINPKEVGNGVQVSEITQNFSQGVLSLTGSEYDFAIDGDGYFVVEGNEQAYTRDGSFAINNNGFLIDPATGGFVQRFGPVGEPINGELGFQSASDSRISIPLGASVPGRETSTIDFLGNLPSTAEPPRTEVLTSLAPLTVAGSPATLTSLLIDLDVNSTDYVPGDLLDITGTNFDGSSFSFSFPADPAATLGDLTSAINANVTGAAMTLSGTGNLLLQADQPGDALLSLSILDNTANTGQTAYEDIGFVIETDGKGPDTVESTLQVFDSRGTPHAINVAFDKIDFNRWNATFSSGDSSTGLIDDQVNEIVFNEQGTFQIVNGSGIGDSNLELTFDSLTGSQTIDVNLEGLTHLATNFAATYEQDGFSPGTIVSMEVDGTGKLSGVATNGRRLDVAQLAIASFTNDHGLHQAGENYFHQTASSGQPTIGEGSSDGRGRIKGGQLESSNVDVALEFTQLIIAQRGFSANARSITVASEILQELNNIF